MRLTAGASFFWLFLALTGCARTIALREAEQGAEVPERGKGEAPRAAEGRRKALPLWVKGSIYLLVCAGAIYGIARNLTLLACEFRLKQATLLLEAKRFPEARYEYEKVVSLNRYSVTAYYKLGHIYASLGDPERALRAYLKVMELSRSYARVHFNLGAVYVSLNDLENARKEFQLATRLDNLPSSWLQLGLAEARLGNLSEAREAVYKALGEDESLEGLNPHLPLGGAYQQAGMLREAEEEYMKALASDPNDYRVHTNLGTVYLDMGRRREAIREYNEAIRLNPQDAVAYVNLASLYAEQGETNMALEMWKKVIVHAPADSELGKRAREILGPRGGG